MAGGPRIAPSGGVRSLVVASFAVVVAICLMIRHGRIVGSNAEAAVNPPADPPIAQAPQVRSIAFEGRSLMSARLREQLATHPGDSLDRARLDRDRQAMEQALAGLGYLAARIAPAVVTLDPAGGAYITFEVDHGPMFHLRNVKVRGVGAGSAVVTLSAGDDAVRDRIERARRGLADFLARRGRPTVVDLSIHTDLVAAAVDVELTAR